MSRKVWVVTRFAHQSYRCFGVFSSEDKAYEYVKAVALKEVKENPMGQEKRMKEKTIEDRYWEDLQLDITEEEVDPVAGG